MACKVVTQWGYRMNPLAPCPADFDIMSTVLGRLPFFLRPLLHVSAVATVAIDPRLMLQLVRHLLAGVC
jgi:hypothetical protein